MVRWGTRGHLWSFRIILENHTFLSETKQIVSPYVFFCTSRYIFIWVPNLRINFKKSFVIVCKAYEFLLVFCNNCWALYWIICKIKRVISRKPRKFYTPPVFSTPTRRLPRRNFANMFDTPKTRMLALPCGEKNYNNILSRFDRISERNEQTDEQMDRQTDGQNCYINIARQCADAR